MKIIICTQCLMYSTNPGDIQFGYCGNCKRETRGKIVELPPDGGLQDALREQALYAIEVYTGRALAMLTDPARVDEAVAAGTHRWQVINAQDLLNDLTDLGLTLTKAPTLPAPPLPGRQPDDLP